MVTKERSYLMLDEAVCAVVLCHHLLGYFFFFIFFLFFLRKVVGIQYL